MQKSICIGHVLLHLLLLLLDLGSSCPQLGPFICFSLQIYQAMLLQRGELHLMLLLCNLLLDRMTL